MAGMRLAGAAGRWMRLVLAAATAAAAVALALPGGTQAAPRAVRAINGPTTAGLLGVSPPLRPLGGDLVGAAPATTTPLAYHGGPVMRTNTTYLIFWIPSGFTVSSGYVSTITQYFRDVAASSGTLSNVYAVNSQYYDAGGHIAHTSTFGGAVTATNAFPANGCTDPGGRTTCVSDAQLRTEITTVMGQQGWTGGANKLYFIFTPRSVGSCYADGFCAYREFCAYHSALSAGGTTTPYANQPYAGSVNGCDSGQHPNADDADATINVASHEHNEAITDPQLNAWYDSDGEENGDKCAWTFGSPLGGTNGSYWNQSINGRHYWLQREWSNASSACVLNMGAGAATSFTVAAAASTVAGAALPVTVTARDDSGAVATSYRGTIHVTSSDGSATLPADYTFSAADAGRHVFASVVLRSAGAQSVTATQGDLTGSTTTTVSAGTVSRFSVTLPATATAGTPVTATITALNSAGYRISGYRGTLHFASTDGAATLPGDYQFTADDAGQHAFAITLTTAGGRAVTVRDTVATSAAGAATVTVGAGAATRLGVTAGASCLAGGSVATTVTALDANGNRVTGFRGTVTLASTDGAATLPGAYAFTSTDAGAHVFSTPVLRTLGSQTISAAAAGGLSGSASVMVNAGSVARFAVTGSASAVAGTGATVTVTAVNAANFKVAGYRGTVHLTSTDGAATLPADYTFDEDDAGAHAFSVTLRTAGTRTLAVRDTVATSATGSLSVAVAGGTAATFTVGAAATSVAGATVAVTVTAKDASGNVATGFRGTVHLTSSDDAATLPADWAFTAGEAGRHVFATPVLRTPGSITVTATSGGVTGATTVAVTAGAVTHFSVAGPASAVSGTPGTWTVTALNAANYRVAGYRGTVHFTSTDGSATLPADTAFSADDAGAHAFSITMSGAGGKTISVRDSVSASASGTTTVTVTGGTATRLVVTMPASAVAGLPAAITVSARDAAGNVATGFRGTVHLASTDSAAVLPPDYAFGAGDNGTHVFGTAVQKTAGVQTVTATSGDMSQTASTTVTPGTVTHFTVASSGSVVAGQPLTVTVTALDVGNNVATGYRGMIHFASTDVTATLPADYAFLAGDNGAHAFTVTLRAAGNHNVGVRSTISISMTGYGAVAVSAS